MRIAFLLLTFPQISETFILNQITGLIVRGHDVHLYARKVIDTQIVHPDIHTYRLMKKLHRPIRLPSGRVQKIIAAARLISCAFLRHPCIVVRIICSARGVDIPRRLLESIPYLQNNRYDIILCHFGIAGMHAVQLRNANALRGKIVTFFHGFDITKFVSYKGVHAYNQLFATGDLFVAISEHWKQHLLKIGCPEKKTLVHHMGIATDKYSCCQRPESTGVHEPCSILSIARLVEKKGIEYGIRAVAQLAHMNLQLQYVIIGTGTLEPELRQLVKNLGMQQIIRFVGAQPQQEVISFLERAAIFLAPSVTAVDGDQEGIPVSIMEAMASGLPVVSSRHSGIAELVKDGKTGYLVEEKDVDMLARRLYHLIVNPHLRSTMGCKGRRIVEQDFSIDTLNARLERILNELHAAQ